MKALKILLKVLLFPVSLILTIFVAVSMFLVERLAGLLHIISGIVFLAALAGFSQYLFGWPFGTAGDAPTLQLVVFATALAFMLSPYGLPMLAMWLLGKLDNLKCAIKSI